MTVARSRSALKTKPKTESVVRRSIHRHRPTLEVRRRTAAPRMAKVGGTQTIYLGMLAPSTVRVNGGGRAFHPGKEGSVQKTLAGEADGARR